MAKYIDGFVLVVPKDKIEEYKKMAEWGRDAWMKHGALAYYESRGDDLVPPDMGGMTARAFPKWPEQAPMIPFWFSLSSFNPKNIGMK